MARFSARKTLMLGFITFSGEMPRLATFVAGSVVHVIGAPHGTIHGSVARLAAGEAGDRRAPRIFAALGTLGTLVARLSARETDFVLGDAVTCVVTLLSASVAY